MDNDTHAVDQLQKMVKIAKDNFEPTRYERVEDLFTHFAERMLIAPASMKIHYHNCYSGGYLDHIHNVIEAVFHVTKSMKTMGADIDFTMEEAIFSAMFHDLGKVGDLTEPYYLPQTSQWHRENQGQIYISNPNLPFMKVPDRALQLLNHFGVTVGPKEWKAILVSDGLFSESNKPYYMGYQYPPPAFHTNLHHVIHFADHMSAIGEKDKHRRGENDGVA